MAAIKNVINNLFYTDVGKIILSIIIGLGIASMFRQFCQGKDCYRFMGPKHSEIRNQIFSYDSQHEHCYNLKEETTECVENKQTLLFA